MGWLSMDRVLKEIEGEVTDEWARITPLKVTSGVIRSPRVTLTPETRAAIMEYVRQGMTYSEVADKLDIPYHRVSAEVYKSRRPSGLAS